MQELGTIGQVLYLRIFFHLADIYDGRPRAGLQFSKRYEDICTEWLGGLTVLEHKLQILRDQLGPHLAQLVRLSFLSGYALEKTLDRAFKLTFRPGRVLSGLRALLPAAPAGAVAVGVPWRSRKRSRTDEGCCIVRRKEDRGRTGRRCKRLEQRCQGSARYHRRHRLCRISPVPAVQPGSGKADQVRRPASRRSQAICPCLPSSERYAVRCRPMRPRPRRSSVPTGTRGRVR
jgi:hypothetical protein